MKKLFTIMGLCCLLMTACSKKDNSSEIIPEDITIAINEIKLSVKQSSIEIGETIQLNAIVLPDDATNKKLIYSSKDENIASISSEGLITGLSVGQVTITANSEDTKISASFILNVNEAFVPVSSITISETNINLIAGTTYQLNPEILPTNSTNKTVSYSYSTENIVEINAKGLITALNKGSVKFTINTIDGNKSIEGTITVENPSPTGSFIDDRDGKEYKTIKIGEQVWMSENLAYLPKVNEGSYAEQEEECYYVFDYNGTNVDEAKASANYSKLGVLYNYKAALSVAPKGWHLPTDEEWQQLEIAIGMDPKHVGQNYQRGSFATVLKATAGWASDGNQGTDNFGFNGTPSGFKDRSGFFGIEYNTRYWTASSGVGYLAIIRGLNAYDEEILRSTGSKNEGYTVRCIKD